MTDRVDTAGAGPGAGAGVPDGSVDADLPPYRGRPAPDPAVVALVATAVDQVWPRPTVPADETDPAHRVWRFSGRWWSKPTPMRRERPWSGR